MNFTVAPLETLAPLPPASAGFASRGRKARVLLVDDHPVTRHGLREVISARHSFEVCGEAANATAALQLIDQTRPDVAVVDVRLGEECGLALTRRLKAHAPHLVILVMSQHEESAFAECALRAGASGYLMKNEASEKLVAALERLQEGELFVSRRVQERMTRAVAGKRRQNLTFPIDRLSTREREVFALIGDGYSTRQISERLGLSAKTIDSYREHLKQKLGMTAGEELVRHAVEWGRVRETL